MSNSGKVRAAHLLIKHTGSRNPVSRRTGEPVTITPSSAMDELRQYQQMIISQNQNENVDLGSIFRKYAEERSDCSSFQHGGDLGEFGHGVMQRAFEEASFALQPGEMSGIVDTDSGYHLIYRIS